MISAIKVAIFSMAHHRFFIFSSNVYYEDLLHLYFRIEKEKAKFQQEVYELLSQVESSNKDKVKYK